MTKQLPDSLLEIKIEGDARLKEIGEQWRAWREDGAHFGYYLANCFRIALGCESSHVSPGNKLEHSYFYGIDDLLPDHTSRYSHLRHARFYDSESS